MILVGDIGGTKTNLALYEVENGEVLSVAKEQFVSSNYTKLSDIIDTFLMQYQQSTINAACFGIAGPVINGECRTTNLPWEIITTKSLEQTLLTPNIALLNDLSATAYGMLYLKPEEIVHLNPNGVFSKATCGVIAAGTGLGEGILYYDGKDFHPLATEGGHCDFAPQDEEEEALLKWLRLSYPNHVSYERVLCGQGISTLYQFVKIHYSFSESDTIRMMDETQDKSAMISRCAIEEQDPLSQKTLRLFCKIYGGEAGNLALKSLSIGGIFIGGGIAPKILPFLNEGIFMEYFLKKGRFGGLLEKIEVKISLNQETALLGAVHYAKDRFLVK